MAGLVGCGIHDRQATMGLEKGGGEEKTLDGTLDALKSTIGWALGLSGTMGHVAWVHEAKKLDVKAHIHVGVWCTDQEIMHGW